MPLINGRVTPPKDMVEAARKSLSAEGFDKLMAQLPAGQSPTAAQLCAAVEKERDDDNRVQQHASQ